MSRILITGAGGFVGRAVCHSLRSAGHTLSGTTRQETKKRGPENIPMYRVSESGKDTDWSQCVVGADAIVHLAGRAHVMKEKSSNLFEAYRIANRDSSVSLAEAAAKAGVKRIVFISTVKVNGEVTTNSPFIETDPPSPEGPYAVSKWEAEKCLEEVAKKHNLELVILRVPLVYGPYVKGNFFELIDACACRKILPLDAIMNRRSLLYVSNLASAINICLEHPIAAGKTYFVSDGTDLSTPELIKKISAALGIKERLYFIPILLLKALGILIGKIEAVTKLTGSLQVDSSLFKYELEWSPPFTVEDGLNETVRWYLNNKRL